jgi:hypothetical protein
LQLRVSLLPQLEELGVVLDGVVEVIVLLLKTHAVLEQRTAV